MDFKNYRVKSISCTGINKILILVTALTISACSTVKYNYAPELKDFSIPELGVRTTKGLGEHLLDQGKSSNRGILKVTKESLISSYKIIPGKLFKVGEDDHSEYFSQDTESGLIITSELLRSAPGIATVVEYKKKTGKYCIASPVAFTVCGQLYVKREKEVVITNSSFRRTLIYSGRVGNKLKISYREFNGNMARSAFSTDVEYDLSESNIIGYAGARLKIISTTNTEIKYTVIKDFNIY
jgi:hypothetical protein